MTEPVRYRTPEEVDAMLRQVERQARDRFASRSPPGELPMRIEPAGTEPDQKWYELPRLDREPWQYLPGRLHELLAAAVGQEIGGASRLWGWSLVTGVTRQEPSCGLSALAAACQRGCTHVRLDPAPPPPELHDNAPAIAFVEAMLAEPDDGSEDDAPPFEPDEAPGTDEARTRAEALSQLAADDADLLPSEHDPARLATLRESVDALRAVTRDTHEYRAGVAEERARVVAHIQDLGRAYVVRAQANTMAGGSAKSYQHLHEFAGLLGRLAALIERGEHAGKGGP